MLKTGTYLPRLIHLLISISNYRENDHGISTSRFIRPEGPGPQLRRRNLRRNRPAVRRMGQYRRKGGATADRHLPGGGRQPVRHGRRLLERRLGGGSRRGSQRPARRGADLDQDIAADGRWAERCRLLAVAPHQGGRGCAEKAWHRLYRS